MIQLLSVKQKYVTQSNSQIIYTYTPNGVLYPSKIERIIIQRLKFGKVLRENVTRIHRFISYDQFEHIFISGVSVT